MENRFGIKDFFLFLFVFILLVMVVLAMVQFDRQYDQVLTIKTQNDQLASDMARIKRQIADISAGGIVAGPTTRSGSTTNPAGKLDAFTHVLEAESLPGFARGGWFLDNFATKVGRLTPLVSQDVYAYWVQGFVQETLAVRDADTLDYVPRVAKSWQISPDGLTMRFFLRDDVTFSDGHPLTADDIVFTYDWIRNPEVNAARDRSGMTTLKDVKKIDNYTVEFTFSSQYYQNFEVAAGTGIMPKHFYSRFTPNQFNEKVGLLLGSGPYMLENPESWTPGNGVILLRNPRYWGVPPTFDRISFSEIEEEAAEEVKYGNQEFDLIRCLPEMYERLIKDPRIMGFSNAYRVKTPYNGYSYIGWNQKRKVNNQDVVTPFADKRVRQAMTMLIDRDRMNKEILLGYATIATGPYLPDNPQSNPDIKPWPYDPAKAKQLLASAGFEDRNGDGVIEDRNGNPLKFKLIYPGGLQFYEKMILFLRDNLAKGGVVMEPERLDWPVMINRLNLGDFDACILAWSTTPESDVYQMFHSSQIQDQGDNRINYINPDLDKIIEQARSTMDHDKRMQLWHQVHTILHEDQPYTFLFNRDALRLFNKRIHNVEPSKLGQNFEFLNPAMIPWFIPKNEQKMMQ
jgi:peptide/nickel transport system substrate-binding protein